MSRRTYYRPPRTPERSWRRRSPVTYEKACYVLWCVQVKGMTITQAAYLNEINSGSACHVIHGRRFPNARPRPQPGLD